MTWQVDWEELQSHVDRERTILDYIEAQVQKNRDNLSQLVPQKEIDRIKALYRETGPENPDTRGHRAKWNCP